jgi:hypothetical protein
MYRGEDLEQSREALPKTLFALSRHKIPNANGSGDMLSRSPVHAGARDGEGYRGSAAARRGKNPRFLICFLVEADRSYIGKPNRPQIAI